MSFLLAHVLSLMPYCTRCNFTTPSILPSKIDTSRGGSINLTCPPSLPLHLRLNQKPLLPLHPPQPVSPRLDLIMVRPTTHLTLSSNRVIPRALIRRSKALICDLDAILVVFVLHVEDELAGFEFRGNFLGEFPRIVWDWRGFCWFQAWRRGVARDRGLFRGPFDSRQTWLCFRTC
jgi:hypothetical protein